MSFGFEEKKVKVPYVESQNAVHGVVGAFPRVKYHEKYPQGIVVENAMEETALGDGWVDSPAEFGVETCPAIEQSDPVAKRIAEVRAAIKAAQE